MENRLGFVSVLAELMLQARSRQKAIEVLGLQQHPTLRHVTSGRDRLYVKVVYHADAWTSSAAPTVRLRGDGGDDGQGPGPGAAVVGNAPGGARAGPSDAGGGGAPPGSSNGGTSSSSSAMAGGGAPSASAGMAGGQVSSSSASGPASSSSGPAATPPPAPGRDTSKSMEGVLPSSTEWARLLKKYLLQGMGSVFSQDKERYFSLPVASTCLQQLQRFILQRPQCAIEDSDDKAGMGSTLVAALTEAEKHHLQQSDLVDVVDRAPAHSEISVADMVKKMVFFRVVRNAPQRVVRPSTTGELNLSMADIGVSVHELMGADCHSGQVTVAASSFRTTSLDDVAASQLVLSLGALSANELRSLWSWTVAEGMSYKLKYVDKAGADAGDDASKLNAHVELPAVLEALSCAGKEGLAQDFKMRAVLHDLQKAGLADCKVNDESVTCWSLTEFGKLAVQVGIRIKDATRAFEPRTVPASDMEVYELMLSLEALGWQHIAIDCRADLKEIACTPYIAGASHKVWFTRMRQQSLNRDYLLLLCTAEDHKLPVPHFAQASEYCKLLGKPVQVFPLWKGLFHIWFWALAGLVNLMHGLRPYVANSFLDTQLDQHPCIEFEPAHPNLYDNGLSKLCRRSVRPSSFLWMRMIGAMAPWRLYRTSGSPGVRVVHQRRGHGQRRPSCQKSVSRMHMKMRAATMAQSTPMTWKMVRVVARVQGLRLPMRRSRRFPALWKRTVTTPSA